ncbi:MAG: HD domain-containing protein, partial [Ignavibacterium sp.]|nr:HD domain-containing protein [Ignavibacterium sp.]MDW8374823.1 HD domain-containing protein [Ignavibacteriales bacterium]
MTAEERTLILGALFHDIGKFEQRCTKNPNKEFHQVLSRNLIKSDRFIDLFQKIVGKENFEVLLNIVSEHHNKSAHGLTKIIQIADHLSASERVEKEEVEVYQDQWKHKHLASLFSKINLLNDEKISPRYYKHKLLVKNEYDVIIPSGKSEDEISAFSYTPKTWDDFLDDLFYTLNTYENERDFNSLINLLLIIFEKYMWCIPDFTGSSETDISLFNHSKDVAGFAHSIYLSQLANTENTNLNLIIGDIPGIQSYIFDVVNRKPAKILRGRSIFVQILTRNLATKLLRSFNLTESNLIMLAGGKFYIIAPTIVDFDKTFNNIRTKIDNYFYDNFRMELSFNCAAYSFDYNDLLIKKKSFGQIVEEASHKLIENRYNLFSNRFFGENRINYRNYVWKEEYIEDDGTGTDSIKCRVTDKPIRKDRKGEIQIPTDDGLEFLTVDKQVEIEYKIGDKIVGNNLIILIDEDELTIDPKNIYKIKDYKNDDKTLNRSKILLNPTFEGLLKEAKYDKSIYKNANYIEVANYCSKGKRDDIMPFEDIAEENDGAKFLSLIKGDIDNLGLIMA